MTTAQKLVSGSHAPKGSASPDQPRGTRGPIGWRQAAAGPWAYAAVLGVLTFTLYSVFSWLQWRSFSIRSWDLGIFTQLAKAYSNFGPPIVSLKGEGYNLLGDHFHPLLVLLGPIYKVFPHAFTLLVVQNLLLALSVVIIARLAVKRLGRFTGICLGAAYALSWGLQSAIDSQFHEIAFAVPLLAFALVALLEERWRSAWIWASLLVFVKEDLGLTVFVIGLVMAFRARNSAGLWLAAWGVAWFVLATKVILPMMNPTQEWAYQSQLDFSGLLANPASLFHPDKVMTVFLLAAITVGLCLFSPLTLAILPTLAWRFLSDLPVYWGQEWQYSAVLMPIVFLASIDALSRRKVLHTARLKRLLGVAMLLISVALTSQYAFGMMLEPAKNFPLATVAPAEAALAAVPNDVTVETDISLMNYLLDRTEVYWLGNANPAPQYVLVDLTWLPESSPTTAADEAQKRHPGTTYEMVFANARYQVAERK